MDQIKCTNADAEAAADDAADKDDGDSDGDLHAGAAVTLVSLVVGLVFNIKYVVTDAYICNS